MLSDGCENPKKPFCVGAELLLDRLANEFEGTPPNVDVVLGMDGWPKLEDGAGREVVVLVKLAKGLVFAEVVFGGAANDQFLHS